MTRAPVSILLPIGLAAGLATALADTTADHDPGAALRQGVRTIAAPGVPGPLCTFGPAALALVAGKADGDLRMPVVACTASGKGRIVAFGHDGYLNPDTLRIADTARFLLNAIRWVANRPTPDARIRVGVPTEALAEWVQVNHLAPLHITGPLSANERDVLGCDALIVSAARLTDADLELARRFLASGRGLIVAGLGWGWHQLNPGKDLVTQHPGNRLLAPAGIAWADGTLDRTAPEGFDVSQSPSPLLHADEALSFLERDSNAAQSRGAEVAQAGAVVLLASGSVPPSDTLLRPRLARFAESTAAGQSPSERSPLGWDRPQARVAFALSVQDCARAPVARLRAHPAAAEFPGPVPADAPRIEREIAVDLAAPGWHSTGLYAAPGEPITVRLPRDFHGRGLAIRIGAHSDRLWDLPRWKRAPDICREEALLAPQTSVGCAFGGPIYVVVSAPEAGKPTGARTLRLRVAGGVEAPYYVHKNTDAAQWNSRLRLLPAPWAELITDRVILTLPSAAIRSLDDPAPLMEFWDRVLDACARFVGRSTHRARPERIVVDAQIAAGYMHAGYPIMVQSDMEAVLVDLPCLRRNGHPGVWGLWHELGHNHQAPEWTFEGTGEVTVNLLTMYVFEQVLGMRAADCHPEISDTSRERKLSDHLGGGADFQAWKRDPFLALISYIQLREAFGWELYEKVFAEYRALSPAERPRDDDAKRDQWLVRTSRAAGRDLGPFFNAWGIPTSTEARAAVRHLPRWMPEPLAAGTSSGPPR